jgi:hypothetical protein
MEVYKLNPEASDLESIWIYGALKWGAFQADQYIDDLDNAFI